MVRGSVGARHNLDLITQIERHEIFCVNSRRTIEECSDKYRTILTVANAGLTAPKSALVTSEAGLKISFEKIGEKFPVVLKTITGSKGIGVFTANDWPSLKSTLQTIWKIDEDTEILIQEYIDADFDMRVHVLGETVLASMKRFKIKDDFRSNYSLGGKVEKVKLTDEQIEIAIKAAKAVGAVWCGVDLMEGEDGETYIIEINSSPGTEGIEKASGVDITSKVLDYILDKDNWTRTPIECGYIEKVDIEGFGELSAKLDTGNGSYCVMHADKYEIEKDKVTWSHNGKEYKHKLEGIKTIRRGGLKEDEEDRPVVLLDVGFAGTVYKDIKFTLSNRESRSTPILLNRMFIRKANLVVNAGKRYVLTVKKAEEIEEATKSIGGVKPSLAKTGTTGKTSGAKKPETKKPEVKKPGEKPEPKRVLPKPSPETIKWWNSHDIKNQKAWIKMKPHGIIAQFVAAGVLKIGVKYGPKSLEEPAQPHEKNINHHDEHEKLSKQIEPPKNEKEKVHSLIKTDKKGVTTIIIPKDSKMTIAQYKDIVKEKLIKEMDKKNFAGNESFNIEEYVKDGVTKIEFRNKTLVKKDTSKSYKGEKPQTENKTYMNKNKEAFVQEKNRFEIPSYLRTGKFSNFDIDMLDRLINAKDAGKFKQLGFFTEEGSGGAGTIQSQSGELLTMVFMGLDEATSKKFYTELKNHLDKARGGHTLSERDKIDTKFQVTRDWLDVAYDTRNAMQFAVDEKFPGKKIDDVVEHLCWDRKNSVEAMGLDYTQKEPSTDVFVLLKDPKTGKKQIMEVSLKKAWGTKIVNSGLGKQLKEWGVNVPDSMKPETFGKDQIKLHEKAIRDNENHYKGVIKNVLQGNEPLGQKILKKYMGIKGKKKGDPPPFVKPDGKPDYDKISKDLFDLSTGGDKKRKTWVLIHERVIKAGGANGEKSKKALKDLVNHSKKFTSNIIYQIKNNPILKDKLMDTVRESLPMRAISSGFETMLVGKDALTPSVMKSVFGTTDWKKISENLDIDTSGPSPVIVYHAGPGEKKVKIGKIECREDGICYGGSGRIKFDISFYNKSNDVSLSSEVASFHKGRGKMNSSIDIFKNTFYLHMLTEDEEIIDDDEDDIEHDVDAWLRKFEKENKEPRIPT